MTTSCPTRRTPAQPAALRRPPTFPLPLALALALGGLGCQSTNPLAEKAETDAGGGGPATGGTDDTTDATTGHGGTGGSGGPGTGGSAGQATGGASVPGDAGPSGDATGTTEPDAGRPIDPTADTDDDGVLDGVDNCPFAANNRQTDTDTDGHGDPCDVCPAVADPDQADTDADGLGDACDPDTPMGPPGDIDDDGIPDAADNCRVVANHEQIDTDADGFGDACDGCPQDALSNAAPCAPAIVLDPERLAFGDVAVDCAEVERTVTVSGPADACLAGAALDGACRGVVILGVDGECRPLNPARSVRVRWAPTQPGALACTLVLDVQGPRPLSLRVPLDGRGVDGRMTERFTLTTPAAVDVVFVMDDSGSMTPIQNAVADRFDAFFTPADAAGTDWRMGVTTTDMDDLGPRGRFIDPGVFSAGPGALAAWMQATRPGNAGSGTEEGLNAAAAALADRVNPGFLRPDAHLAVLIVSDEDDQGGGDVQDVVDDLRGATDGHPERLTFVGVVSVDAAGDPDTCDVGDLVGDPANRYVEAFDAVGGRGWPICGDLTASLSAAGARIFGPTRAFPLATRPNGDVTVRIDGREDARWSYDRDDRVLRLDARAPTPAAGTVLDVEYDVDCGD
jgi:hypothetical protein